MRKVKILLSITLIMIALLGTLMIVSGEEKTFTIRFQHIGSAADNPIHFVPWANMVEKATNGRVKIMLHSSCELVPDENMLPALKAGTLDAIGYASFCNPSLTDLGAIETLFVCGLENQLEQMCLYRYHGYEDLVREDYEEYGVYYVGPALFDPAFNLITTKPVKSISDLKGLKISSFESVIKPFIDHGAVQINISPDELYLAGKTGVIDGLVWGGAPCYYYNSWHEVYPYLLDESMGNFCLNLLFNKKVWNSLPEDIQAIFELSLVWLGDHSKHLYYNDTSKYRSAFTVTKFSEEDHQKILQSAMEYWDELAMENERLAIAIQMYKDYNKELDDARWYR